MPRFIMPGSDCHIWDYRGICAVNIDYYNYYYSPMDTLWAKGIIKPIHEYTGWDTIWDRASACTCQPPYNAGTAWAFLQYLLLD